MKNVIQKQKANSFSVLNKLGVLSIAALSVAATSFAFFPEASANAATTANVTATANVGSVVSVAVNTNTLTYNITPTAAGAFDSKSVTATVDTNSSTGYKLYFSSVDTGTAMTHSNSSITNTIASDFSSSVTSASMAVNKWGYSLDGTNYSKIPASNAQAVVKNINHLPSSSEKTAAVTIGVKVDTSLPSGAYSKDVKFTVVAN